MAVKFRINEILEKSIFMGDKTVSHICDFWEIVYVLKGTLSVTAEENVYKLSGNDIAILSPDVFHSIKGDENCRFLYASFKGEGDFFEDLKNKVTNLGEKEIYFAENLCLIAEHEDDISNQQFCSLTEFLLLCCISLKDIEPDFSHKDAILYKKAAEILKDNISKQISVEELAEKLNISLSHLKRVFRRYTLTGVHEYYTALKIAKAKEFLLQGITVTETSELTGFANQGYFSAAFKRITDMTPKEFSGKVTTPKQPRKSVKSRNLNSMPDYLL